MLGCMKGDKTKACCCCPLAVAALLASCVVLITNGAMFGQQWSAMRNGTHDRASAIISLIFVGIPLVCVGIAVIGILFSHAGMIAAGVKAVMPALVLTVVACIKMWIEICQDPKYIKRYVDTDKEGDELKKIGYIYGGGATVIALICMSVLCWVGNIYKSAATMLRRHHSIWRVHSGRDHLVSNASTV